MASIDPARAVVRFPDVCRELGLSATTLRRICRFLLVWIGCWFGGWIAGGLLFPAYETPAMIGAFLGFWIGALGGGLLTRLDRLNSNEEKAKP